MSRVAPLALCIVALSCRPPASSLDDLETRPAMQSANDLSEVEQRVIARVLDTLALEPPLDAPICVKIASEGGAAQAVPASLLVRLRDSRRLRSPDPCPPTYDSPAIVVDSLGRSLSPVGPKGHVDPIDLSVDRPRVVAGEQTIVHVERRLGSRGQRLRCFVPADSLARVICRVHSSWIS